MSDLDKRDERRVQPRCGPEVEPTYIWLGVEKGLQARVIDVSVGGLGILLDKNNFDELIDAGFQVRVQTAKNERRTASIVYVRPDGEGRRVGLKWVD